MRGFFKASSGAKRLHLGAIVLLGAVMHPAHVVIARTADGPPAAVLSVGAEAAASRQRITTDPVDSKPVASPDRRHLAFIRRTSAVPDDFDRFPSQLMLYTMGDGDPRPAATGSPPDRVQPSVRNPHWSSDGRFVYVLAAAYAVSDIVVQVDILTGQQKAVIDGNSLAVIQNGPWRGHLLVRRHKYRPKGGSYDPFDVVRPDGHVRFTVPGSERDDGRDDHGSAWLKARGWTAR